MHCGMGIGGRQCQVKRLRQEGSGQHRAAAPNAGHPSARLALQPSRGRLPVCAAQHVKTVS